MPLLIGPICGYIPAFPTHHCALACRGHGNAIRAHPRPQNQRIWCVYPNQDVVNESLHLFVSAHAFNQDAGAIASFHSLTSMIHLRRPRSQRPTTHAPYLAWSRGFYVQCDPDPWMSDRLRAFPSALSGNFIS